VSERAVSSWLPSLIASPHPALPDQPDVIFHPITGFKIGMPGSFIRYNKNDTFLSSFGPKEDKFLVNINSSGGEIINRM
jgi:hypothetical protein